MAAATAGHEFSLRDRAIIIGIDALEVGNVGLSTSSSSSARRIEPGAFLSSDISDFISSPTITGTAEPHEHQRIHLHSNNGRRRNWLGESSIRIRLDPLRVR